MNKIKKLNYGQFSLGSKLRFPSYIAAACVKFSQVSITESRIFIWLKELHVQSDLMWTRVTCRLTLALTLAAGLSRCFPAQRLVPNSLTPLFPSNKRPEDKSESESLIKAEVIKVCLLLLSDSIRLIVKPSGNWAEVTLASGLRGHSVHHLSRFLLLSRLSSPIKPRVF